MGKGNSIGIDTKRLYTVKETAYYLGLSHWTIREHISNGILPCVTLGRRKLIDKNDIDHILEANKTREII